jgi:hypothetical protein
MTPVKPLDGPAAVVDRGRRAVLLWWPMSRSTKATVVFLSLFIAFVVIRSLRTPAVECEVCITYDGQQQCGKASSDTRARAIQSATTAACATLAGGMTESIHCQNTRPDKAVCTGG